MRGPRAPGSTTVLVAATCHRTRPPAVAVPITPAPRPAHPHPSQLWDQARSGEGGDGLWLAGFLAWAPLLLWLSLRRPKAYLRLRTPLVLLSRLHRSLTCEWYGQVGGHACEAAAGPSELAVVVFAALQTWCSLHPATACGAPAAPRLAHRARCHPFPLPTVMRWAGLFSREAMGAGGAAGSISRQAQLGLLLWRVSSGTRAATAASWCYRLLPGGCMHCLCGCLAQLHAGPAAATRMLGLSRNRLCNQPPAPPVRLQPTSLVSLLFTYLVPFRFAAPCAVVMLSMALHGAAQQCAAYCRGSGVERAAVQLAPGVLHDACLVLLQRFLCPHVQRCSCSAAAAAATTAAAAQAAAPLLVWPLTGVRLGARSLGLQGRGLLALQRIVVQWGRTAHGCCCCSSL